MFVFGTRPEAIKVAPVILKMKQDPFFDVKVVVTAQHREMLDEVLRLFDIVPDYDLDIMRHAQTLYHITTNVLNMLGVIFKSNKPDLVLVHGDTTTTLSASLAAFYEGIPVGHIEAGLRSGDIKNPFPEEMNRVLTDDIATLHFAPTNNARRILEYEQKRVENIYVTGNTVIDILFHITRNENYRAKILDKISEGDFIFATIHRRESWGEPLEEICDALNEITKKTEIKIVLSSHPNPIVKETITEKLKDNKNVILINALGYRDLISVLKRAKLILTDSGGIQEEAPSLGIPVLVLRNKTERSEAIDEGVARLVGTSKDKIVDETIKLLTDDDLYNKMSRKVNVYGDGMASDRIINAIKYYYGEIKERPDGFRG